MHKDYSVTIFSRNKGKTRTFNLNRRTVFLPLLLTVGLVLGCFLFGKAYFHERQERQRLESRIALLEQPMNKSEGRSEKQGGDSPPKTSREAADRPSVNLAKVSATGKTESGPRTVRAEAGSRASTRFEPAAVVEIEDPKAGSLEQDREGFKFTFKLANVAGEQVAGNVAIIASLSPPHEPRYVSFPSMRLVGGEPVKLRKTVGFSIRYFKYVTGRFYFPFSYCEAFRILIYDRDEDLLLDSTVLAENVEVDASLTKQAASSDSPEDRDAPTGDSAATTEQVASSDSPAAEDVPTVDSSATTVNEQPTTDSSVQNPQ